MHGSRSTLVQTPLVPNLSVLFTHKAKGKLMKRFRRYGAFQPGEIILSDPAMRTRVAFQRVTPEDLGVMAQWQSAIEDQRIAIVAARRRALAVDRSISVSCAF